MNKDDPSAIVVRVLLEFNKEPEVVSKPINANDYEAGTWLLIVYQTSARLFINETYIESSTRNMNAKRWEFQYIADIPDKLKIYLLIGQP